MALKTFFNVCHCNSPPWRNFRNYISPTLTKCLLHNCISAYPQSQFFSNPQLKTKVAPHLHIRTSITNCLSVALNIVAKLWLQTFTVGHSLIRNSQLDLDFDLLGSKLIFLSEATPGSENNIRQIWIWLLIQNQGEKIIMDLM